jgi:hypothetical protein
MAAAPFTDFEEWVALEDAEQCGQLFDLPAKLRISLLNRRFGWAPSTVFRTADGRWRARKTQWLELGIKSEIGRADNLLELSKTLRADGWDGTSVFDPVLSELVFRWCCPEGGAILDPFAGGSVRGIVAGVLGFSYTGVELRPEQVGANKARARRLTAHELRRRPRWIEGDALQQLPRLAEAGRRFDMVFTCPPYGQKEKYSELEADLSNMPEEEFDRRLGEAVRLSTELLAPDRFSVWVIGDERRTDGTLHGIPQRLIAAGEDAGLRLYNDAILATPRGSGSKGDARLFEPYGALAPEPPRDSWRLQLVRGWRHDQSREVSAGAPGPCRPHGLRASG